MLIGMDIGSTTVKCVVVDPETLEILWSRYERHETRQAEKLIEMLEAIHADFPDTKVEDFRAFITGSGAGPLSEPVGSRFVQEVNAVTLAVEKLHPDVNSVVELGGQDAKIIIFKNNPETGERHIITSMNDKCASGTGATIDKCVIKVGLDSEQLSALEFDAGKLHHVAAKCGVFAETDIVNLIKAGVPAGEVMNSLANAIVMQNLTVLTRGNTLAPTVLLLGGPNTYLSFLQQAWRLRIPETWADRGFEVPDIPVEKLVIIPENGQYYAAYGAVIFGTQSIEKPLAYLGIESLRQFIQLGRQAHMACDAGKGLVASKEELEQFRKAYKIPQYSPAHFEAGTVVRGYIGLDGGSTSSKAVLIDEQGDILKKEYRLSQGNPIQDTKEILANIKDYVTEQGASLEILGFGATGYAADVLEKSVRVDANIVETVAHMMSAQKYCGNNIDVICDIGGQDIKVMFLQHGRIKSFRLSNQCSAGNGMLLQAMAAQFGVAVEDYADIAFSADLAPRFSYGCAVFLDTDRVNFQKEGFAKEELFSGLAQVLPKNVWQYVVQIPRMAELGKNYVLQGGTQYNLAAVKAQVDYIKERVPGATIRVHPHTGEAGAIGAALEAKRVVERRGSSTFIGLDEAINLRYSSRTDEETRCTFCDNLCSRTFIDTEMPDGETSRYIAGFSCEKGTVESKTAVVELNKERRRLKSIYPNLVDYEANFTFRHFYKCPAMPEAGEPLLDEKIKPGWLGFGQRRIIAERGFEHSDEASREHRKNIRIGIPRALNVYTLAPFIRAYLEALGIDRRNIVFSDQTSEELWQDGGKYGSIDPCFPAKVSLAHIHALLHPKGHRKPLNYIWFPTVIDMNSFASHTMSNNSCPVVAGTPNVVKAAFTKEKDFFASANVTYLDHALNFDKTPLLKQQLFKQWSEYLGITEDESDWACEQGQEAMRLADDELQERALDILNKAERENSVVLLLIGRPYHNDPGLNHEIMEEFQTLGYPVLSIRSIPKDENYLRRFFEEDLRSGTIEDVFDVRDVWPENYSVNSVQKVWASKFAARHPNVAILDISNFKCGHDAPTYGIIDRIIATSKTPYLAMHDLDANKPSGSIKIRVKTFAYSLALYQEQLEDMASNQSELEKRVSAKRFELVEKRLAELSKEHQYQDALSWESLKKAYQAYLEKDGEKIPVDFETYLKREIPVSIEPNVSNISNK